MLVKHATERGSENKKKNLAFDKFRKRKNKKIKGANALQRVLSKAASTNAQLREVDSAFREEFRPKVGSALAEPRPYYYVKETFLDDGYLIVQSDGDLYKVNFKRKDGGYVFDAAEDWAEMEQVYRVKELDLVGVAFKHPGHPNQKVHGSRAGKIVGGIVGAAAGRRAGGLIGGLVGARAGASIGSRLPGRATAKFRWWKRQGKRGVNAIRRKKPYARGRKLTRRDLKRGVRAIRRGVGRLRRRRPYTRGRKIGR